MPPVRKVESQNRISGLQAGVVYRGVGLRSRVGLYIGILRPEEFLGPVDGQLLDFIDYFAAAVIPPARVALCVFVRQDAADRLLRLVSLGSLIGATAVLSSVVSDLV